ncbi:MAG: glycosyltransferase, partial [Candidatus Cloacimonetes bacterium]|nr:glycosyltransferase [Candidatus Cloacimonadota bacterium]
ATAARNKVLAEHTYQHRLNDMLKVALKHSAKISSKVSAEQAKVRLIKETAVDQKLEDMLAKLKPADRFHFASLMEEIHSSTEPLEQHEALLLLLESFYKGE